MVYGYASWFQLVGAGIVEGRLLSAILGAASVLLVCFTVHRRVGLLPAVVGGLLLAGCLHFVYDTVVIKTQSLTVFLSACLLFVLANEESRRPVVRVCLAMVFGTLLFFTRLTFLPVLLLLWMLLGWQMRARPGLFVGLLVLNVLPPTLLAIFGFPQTATCRSEFIAYTRNIFLEETGRLCGWAGRSKHGSATNLPSFCSSLRRVSFLFYRRRRSCGRF